MNKIDRFDSKFSAINVTKNHAVKGNKQKELWLKQGMKKSPIIVDSFINIIEKPNTYCKAVKKYKINP
jgi:hypothetical protein